jgi:hypothetical protein
MPGIATSNDAAMQLGTPANGVLFNTRFLSIDDVLEGIETNVGYRDALPAWLLP